MNWFKSTKLFVVATVLTAVCATVSVSKRIAVENANHNVLFVAESDTVESLAAAQGLTLEQALPKLKEKGLGGLVLSEQTIGELISEGRADLVGITVQAANSEAKSLAFADSATVERVVKGMGIRFGKLIQNTTPRDNRLALPPVDTNSLRSTAIGLDPKLVALAQKNKLAIVARCSNPVGISSKAVISTITWAKEMGATIFLAQGEQVLGRRDALETTMEALVNNGMLYASPEFAKLGGDPEAINQIPEHVVRLHSAQAAELDKLTIPAAIERYRKAARERNMRVLLLRSVTQASDAPLDAFGDFMVQLRAQLESEGLTLGAPEPYVDPGVSKVFKIAIGVFGGLAAFALFTALIPTQKGQIAGGLFALAIAAGSATNGMGLKLSAVMLSMVFPIGAYVWMIRAKLHFIPATILTSLFAMVGGLCVAGLLNGIDFYIRADAFPMVKVSVFFPILVIGILCFAHLNDLKTSLKEPITWGAAALGIIILAALGLMIIRTGNDSPNTVSGGELAFRGLLEQLMPVRPRTKEFLIGFPALFIGIAMLHAANYEGAKLGKTAGWAALLIMLGSIALTDIVNTLCHLHTPVMISVIRNIEGLVLGMIFGAVVWFPLRKKIVGYMDTSNG